VLITDKGKKTAIYNGKPLEADSHSQVNEEEATRNEAEGSMIKNKEGSTSVVDDVSSTYPLPSMIVLMVQEDSAEDEDSAWTSVNNYLAEVEARAPAAPPSPIQISDTRYYRHHPQSYLDSWRGYSLNPQPILRYGFRFPTSNVRGAEDEASRDGSEELKGEEHEELLRLSYL
jgi:hypothetical protein